MAVLQKTDILLPEEAVNMEKWAVIACDQFTSQPEYWNRVKEVVGEAPSILHMVYPEAFLKTDDKERYWRRIEQIQEYMRRCLEEKILIKKVSQGYVLTVRETEAGIRVGLLAALDLENYDYRRGTKAKARATEATVPSRIPIRVGIRRKAPVEAPHVMMLLDDGECRLLEPLYHDRKNFSKLYDTELMLGGGRVKGYGITGIHADAVTEKLTQMEKESEGIFLAAGDGNHSLAAAKSCWEETKKTLTEAEKEDHPARYALVEVVNIHSPALAFHPIHRAVFGADLEAVEKGFAIWLKEKGFSWKETKDAQEADLVFCQGQRRFCMQLGGTKGRIPVEILQEFLDEYVREHPETDVDYVHDKQAVEELAKNRNACGILLKAIEKDRFFLSIEAGGILPRKTFSIGEDCQKRYYVECRRISKETPAD